MAVFRAHLKPPPAAKESEGRLLRSANSDPDGGRDGEVGVAGQGVPLGAALSDRRPRSRSGSGRSGIWSTPA